MEQLLYQWHFVLLNSLPHFTSLVLVLGHDASKQQMTTVNNLCNEQGGGCYYRRGGLAARTGVCIIKYPVLKRLKDFQCNSMWVRTRGDFRLSFSAANVESGSLSLYRSDCNKKLPWLCHGCTL